VDEGLLTIFLCGDVMTGRGVDQILPHPGDPALREQHVPDARIYVRLAEAVSGPIPRPAGYGWPWGDALPVLDSLAPDARVINLETSITRRDTFAPGKGIHYRMSPANTGCLLAAHPDVCTLANNHMLDFGQGGLADTLDAPGWRRPAPGGTRPWLASRRPSAWPAAAGSWSSPAARRPAASRRTGRPARAGPA